MSIKLGIHTGPQEISMEELTRLWKRADEAGFHWISVWDHFYANPLQGDRSSCFEGVASMAALAAMTKNVRVGCLMFCALFRNPGLLAKAAVTIDHISNGRVELGIGGGWFKEEFEDFGYEFPPIGKRLDELEESLEVTRSLLREKSTTFNGKYYQMNGAMTLPPPVQKKLPLWVGGLGPKRTPQIAARYADGFNMPYVSPEVFAQRQQVVDAEAEKIGRDPAEIERTVNLGFYMGATEAEAEKNKKQFAGFDESRRAGMLFGTPNQVIDRIGEYIDAGAAGMNIAFRPPVDWTAFEAYISDVLPHFLKK